MRINALSVSVFLLSFFFCPGLEALAQDPDAIKLPTYLSGEEPHVLHADLPRYPPLALEARLEGEVRVRVSVSRGKILDTKVIPPANPIRSLAALENIRTWEFRDYDSQVIEVLYTFAVVPYESLSFRNPRIEFDLPDKVKITGYPIKPTVLN